MSTIVACFKWLDLLETQFDKSWVELDHLLENLDEDEDFIDIHRSGRKHATSLASCFSQLSHKSTTIFQNNAKLEAELINLREEVCNHRATLSRLTKDKEYLTNNLQSCLEENQKLKCLKFNGTNSDDKLNSDIAKDKKLSEHIPTCKDEQSYNGSEKFEISEICLDIERSECLSYENANLREGLLEMESELVGARLDNVYLEKELAGRIQQLQLLLAAGTSPEMKERMWGQIEVEMCLQRAKTIGQMCHTKQEVKNKMRQEKKVRKESINGINHDRNQEFGEGEDESKCKQVNILKNPADDLGIAIVGGKDHNLPIIISEIFPDSAVARTNKVNAGDVIMSVNGESMVDMDHKKAVGHLSSLRGRITMDLRGVEVCKEDDPGNLDYRFYQMFHHEERRDSQVDGRSLHPGRAMSSLDLDNIEDVAKDKVEDVAKDKVEDGVRGKGEKVVSNKGEKDLDTAIAVNGAGVHELPQIHSSPRRKPVL